MSLASLKLQLREYPSLATLLHMLNNTKMLTELDVTPDMIAYALVTSTTREAAAMALEPSGEEFDSVLEFRRAALQNVAMTINTTSIERALDQTTDLLHQARRDAIERMCKVYPQHREALERAFGAVRL